MFTSYAIMCHVSFRGVGYNSVAPNSLPQITVPMYFVICIYIYIYIYLILHSEEGFDNVCKHRSTLDLSLYFTCMYPHRDLDYTFRICIVFTYIPFYKTIMHGSLKHDLEKMNTHINPYQKRYLCVPMGVSKNRGTQKWMIYNGKPY